MSFLLDKDKVPKVRHWKIVNREIVADCKVFTVHKYVTHKHDEGHLPHHDFYVFKPSNWVNLIAVTKDLHVVLVEQYRHGVETTTLEIPGGMIDAEDESPLTAGLRELFEETGYRGTETHFLGRNHPNPAIQGNTCDTYLVLNCEQVEIPQFSGTEEIALSVVPLAKIGALIKSGAISHALVVAAFYYLHRFTLENPDYAYLNTN